MRSTMRSHACLQEEYDILSRTHEVSTEPRIGGYRSSPGTASRCTAQSGVLGVHDAVVVITGGTIPPIQYHSAILVRCRQRSLLPPIQFGTGTTTPVRYRTARRPRAHALGQYRSSRSKLVGRYIPRARSYRALHSKRVGAYQVQGRLPHHPPPLLVAPYASSVPYVSQQKGSTIRELSTAHRIVKGQHFSRGQYWAWSPMFVGSWGIWCRSVPAI
eukprot:3941867-Rhodomonas_salina.2